MNDWDDDMDDSWGRDDNLVAASGLDQTRDDTDAGWGELSLAGRDDPADLERFLAERPPHHGD
jgi:hypothetical protein